jgi:tetratricopeptide (TPR) repeat protein
VLLRALAADGRPAEALTHYETVRRHLAEELGADPSAELQAVYQSILQGAPAGAVTAEVPAQLPADVPGFTGRGEQLALLDATVRDSGPTVAICVVSGTAGVGKTALAVHWAHTVAGLFPDGQLYVNLRGFDPAGRVTDPAESVRGFLDALGVPHERVPSGLDAQAALYRSLLAGKRILVLLDNARDAEQVRPLLPATAGAVAVVTSRNQLTGLLAAEGAHPVTLDVLGEQEARELLSRRIGAEAGAEAGAVRDIVAACARLPLALAIAAARARQNSFPLAALAAELVNAGDRLDALDIGDPAVQVRAVFSWSYAALSAEAGRLFRLLSLSPGPDISTAAAASLAGHPLGHTRRLLAELAQANLIVEHTPGRYVSHDLLRTYAAELTGRHDTESARRAATVRLLDHYVHTAHAADRLLYPARDPIELPLLPAAAESRPESPADHQRAMAWFSAEHPVLLAAARSAARTGQDTHAWQLAWALDTFLYRRGHWHDRAAVWAGALPAAERLGDLDAQATGHRSIARASVTLGRRDDAHIHLHRALDLCVRSGNPAGQANVHNNLSFLISQQKDYPRALEHNREALALYRAVGNLRGQAAALSSMSWQYDLMGDFPQAIVHCRQAIDLMRQVGDRRGEADVSDSLGYAYHHLGRHAEAADCYRHALELVRDTGDRHAEAEILVHLGDTHDASGDRLAARRAWDEALAIFTDLDHPEAQQVRDKLDGLPGAVAH